MKWITEISKIVNSKYLKSYQMLPVFQTLDPYLKNHALTLVEHLFHKGRK